MDAAGIEAGTAWVFACDDRCPEIGGAGEEVGRHLARMALRMRDEAGPDCLIPGGEPTVTLVDEYVRGQGGRNQQLAPAACLCSATVARLLFFRRVPMAKTGRLMRRGAPVNETVALAASESGLDVGEYLSNNDAYTFFQRAGACSSQAPLTLTCAI